MIESVLCIIAAICLDNVTICLILVLIYVDYTVIFCILSNNFMMMDFSSKLISNR